jgi:tetratricopeptide (TPR) repeat protein
MAQTEIAVVLASARQAFAEKRMDDAIALLNGVPTPSADVSSMLGAAYSSKNDLNNALVCFQVAVSLQPTARNHFNLAALHKMRNDPHEAAIALQEALKLDPGYEKAQQMLDALPPEALQTEPRIGEAPAPPPTAAPASDIFPEFAGGDPLRQSMYPSAMPKAQDAESEKPGYVPSEKLLTFRCTQIIERFGDWWPYMGWMGFLSWLIVPMASGSVAAFVVLSLLFGAWWIIDICDQLIPWYHVLGGLALIIIGTICPAGRLILSVGTWCLYWFMGRD